MSAGDRDIVGQVTGRCVEATVRHPIPTLLVAAAAAGAATWGAVTGLRVDPSTSRMFSEDLSWRQDIEAFRDAFPELSDNLVFVVDAATGPLADEAARRLADRLEERSDRFDGIHRGGSEPYYRRHGLLFRDSDELETLEERVEEIAPLLRRIEASPDLPTFASVMDSALRRDVREAGGSLLGSREVLGLLARGFAQAAARQPHRVPWGRLLEPEDAGPRRVVTATLAEQVNRPRVRADAVEAARAAADGVEAGPPAPRIRLTGSVAMEHEEQLSAARGAAIAGVLAFVLVAGLLFLGLGSWRLIGVVMATLVTGLVLTFGFAAVAVDDLNLISVAFVVLFIGLGVDYALHLVLRVQELHLDGDGVVAASGRAGRQVGGAIALSALTTALCFFAFLPTDFSGVSQLGLLGGAGMIVGCVTTLTVLPALLQLTGLPERPPPVTGRRALSKLAGWLDRRRRAVLIVAGGLALIGTALLPAVRFDHNLLHLRDPGAESVQAYLDLLRDRQFDPLTISVLRPDAAAAEAVAAELDELQVVDGTATLSDLVPSRQAEKLPVLAEIRARLGAPPSPDGAEEPGANSPQADRRLRVTTAGADARPAGTTGWEEATRALGRLRYALSVYREAAPGRAASAARSLAFETGRWEATAGLWPEADRPLRVAELERSLLGDLPALTRDLRAATAVREPAGLADVPAELERRWASPDGRHRVEVRPAVDPSRTDDLVAFVDGVRAVAPGATGSPVTQREAGRAAVEAFRTALVLAAVALLGVLLVVLRSPSLSARVMLPLALAAVLTAAGTVVLGIPFNFANLITIPLLLGVGVDAGIHLVHRSRGLSGAPAGVVATSTGRAVVLSLLTTVLSFGNLGFSAHRGTASMGRLLAVGMLLTLVCSLTVLPALLPGDGAPGPDGGRR